MDSMDDSFSLTIEDLRSYHSVDREFYARLVINLARNPIECMQFFAFLLWLEEAGFPDLIKKMSSLTDDVVTSLADEARHCLDCITSETPPPLPSSIDGQIPLLKNLANDNQQISLQFLYENRFKVLTAISKTVTNVCPKVFEDIMQQAFVNAAATAVPTPTSPELVLPPSITDTDESSFSRSNLNREAEPWVPKYEHKRERTMFITFSRGYPISENQVREFFVRSFGNCVESLQMHEVGPNEQPLYCRLILRSTSTIPLILDGKERVKFVIDGKHMRVRRSSA